MQLLRPSLLGGRTGGFLAAFLLIVLSYALLIEYHQYTKLTQFDDVEINATVLQLYPKEKESKPYFIAKLRLDNGATMYTAFKPKYAEVVHKKVRLNIWVKANFLEYLRGFYSFSKVREIYPTKNYKTKLSDTIATQHDSKWMQEMYGALFLAEGMSQELQQKLSALGVSHLLAISGFHLGVLSMLVVGLFYLPYQSLQSRYFPYRSRHKDLFWISMVVLVSYLYFLGMVPSLIRAFVMLLVGYLFFDRGLKIISMQTLFVTVAIILALFPRLLFSMGLWLSVAGVYYIFLFFMYIKMIDKKWIYFLLPLWVYVMMLPISLYVFENFSLLHPVSILWTLLFTLYYPLSALMHVVGAGNYLDDPILRILNSVEVMKLTFVHPFIMLIYLVASIGALRYKSALVVTIVIALLILLRAIYQVA